MFNDTLFNTHHVTECEMTVSLILTYWSELHKVIELVKKSQIGGKVPDFQHLN